MANISTYLEDALLSAVLRQAAYTSPTHVYLALFTAAPNAGGGGTEVSGGGYARQQIDGSSSAFGAPASGSTSNGGTITFPTATVTWGTVTSWGIFDALTGGNLLFFGTLVGVNEVQSLAMSGSPTGGTFTLSFGGQTTEPIPYNATAAQVQAFLEALSSIGEDNVSCSGGALPGTAVTITFQGTLAGAAQSLITHTDSFTGGTSPAAAVSETTLGETGSKTINTGDTFEVTANKATVSIS